MQSAGRTVSVWGNFCFRTVDPLVYYMIQICFFVFWVLFCVWFVFWVGFSPWFGALSMLSIMTFDVVEGEDSGWFFTVASSLLGCGAVAVLKLLTDRFATTTSKRVAVRK